MPSCSASESDSKYVRQIFKHGTSRLFEIIGESKPKRLSASCRQPLHIIPDIPSTLEQQDLQVFDLFFRSFAGESFRAGFRAIQNTPKTPARSGSGLCLFSLFRRDRLRQLRKNTDMHPLVGNNLIEKLDSYCGRLCQLFGIVFRIRSINC